MPTETMLILAISALCIGISKAGFSGVSLIAVYLLAQTFGAKESLGIALPMLILADLIVYPAFRKHGSWSQVWPVLFPALIGMTLAFILLPYLPNNVMKPIIGIIILSMALIQIIRKFYANQIEHMARSITFRYASASSGGIATVLANAAGPIFQLYFLTIKIPKMELIGVCARFFLVANLIKLPLNAQLNLITQETITMNLYLAPILATGIFAGKKFLHRIPQKNFEYIILATAMLAGIRLTFF
ncbi:MAG: sulfite exporter TauE/SafE family protein [Akkermansiaceae bacterium]